jgi:uncharacterized protein YndB with AHSA1/START domain
MTPDLEVSRDIAASPSVVFAALTDITRMGEWSPETYLAEWNEGCMQAAVVATYTGHNRHEARAAHNRASMATTLERLAAGVE